MGHNGGFNPYRDANGEFADPATSGKPGRSRKGSGGVARPRSAPAAPNITRGKFSSPTAQQYNPTGLNQALLNGRTPPGFKANTIGYRARGQDIYGDWDALKKSRPPR
jgi:hypothetical protein